MRICESIADFQSQMKVPESQQASSNQAAPESTSGAKTPGPKRRCCHLLQPEVAPSWAIPSPPEGQQSQRAASPFSTHYSRAWAQLARLWRAASRDCRCWCLPGARTLGTAGLHLPGLQLSRALPKIGCCNHLGQRPR